MKGKIYLKGCKSCSGEHVLCPLTSSCILFFLGYCQTKEFEVIFISDQNQSGACTEVPLLLLQSISVTFLSWDEAPAKVRNVCLPSVLQAEMSLVRAGLCVVLRHIIKSADAEAPRKKIIDLLGFRQGSMRMCSEVSGWTKLCEVDLSDSVTLLIQTLKELKGPNFVQHDAKTILTLPSDLLKLESHFGKKCKVHNDDKKKRAEISRLKKLLSDSGSTISDTAKNEKGDRAETKRTRNEDSQLDSVAQTVESQKENGSNQESDAIVEKIAISQSRFEVEHFVKLPHGIRRVRVLKDLDVNENTAELVSAFSALSLDSMEYEEPLSDVHLGQIMTLPGITEVVERLTYLNVEYVHTYSEGAEITLADLILFVYFYYFMEQLDFLCCAVAEHLPNILHWAEHMVSLPSVIQAGQSLGWNLPDMARGLKLLSYHERDLTNEHANLYFKQPQQPICEDENDMELIRNVQMKHKAIKPEVQQALKKLQEAEIAPCIGQHPRGENVTVDWNQLPPGIHPRQGDVPEKRTRRKCQQLENLATAVQEVAEHGNVVIDFCSGGGHLGIVLAYLLPHCQIYLVENKEESLLKACSRLESLALTNVTLYQCNIDYFQGKFDVGVCLHACGSATDMVQELCLNAGASFVICPCCYGSIHKTHLLSYPRSKQFQNSEITYKDFLTLGHAADQTEFNIALEGQGRECMNLVDSDRAAYARELGYQVTLCSLQPLSCTPKNNLLVGYPNGSKG